MLIDFLLSPQRVDLGSPGFAVCICRGGGGFSTAKSKSECLIVEGSERETSCV